jgi:hypothetical protein
LESQRVKLLTEGYLRGWLTFEYPNGSSYVREEIILNYIEDERIYALLKNRLTIETVLRGTSSARGKNFLDPVFAVANELVGLKLPLLKAEDKIKDNTKTATGTPYTREQIDEWKKVLAELNKNNV